MLRSVKALILLLALAGCAQTSSITPVARYNPVAFTELAGWSGDDILSARPALLNSCTRLLSRPPTQSLSANSALGTAGDWKPFCQALPAASTAPMLRSLIERELRPYAVTAGRIETGLFTGYYEASLKGSKTRGGPYQTPLYARPADLVTGELGDFKPELKGQKITARVVNGQLKPYPDRKSIVNGAIATTAQPIVWVSDPIAAFFLQVQGSGRIELREGGVLHVGYAAQNGHPYTAIGKTLVERGAVKKDDVSMQSITRWLKDNPTQAAEVMNSNRSYVFFTPQPAGQGPVGASNVSLTPRRSLAVDYRSIPHHAPVWLETAEPALRQLMVAQDTGGAIRGAVRGDVFWGYGPQAEATAGKMKSSGRYYVLLPKALPAP